ncbi:MAG: hypothetical protein ABIU54_01540 [Candidatus Eisenbacteria bacterium]
MKKLLLSLALLAVMQSVAAPLHAEEEPPTGEHRFGVIMMVVCGISTRLAAVAPVPFAGVAAASCVAGCLDALIDPD